MREAISTSVALPHLGPPRQAPESKGCSAARSWQSSEARWLLVSSRAAPIPSTAPLETGPGLGVLGVQRGYAIPAVPSRQGRVSGSPSVSPVAAGSRAGRTAVLLRHEDLFTQLFLGHLPTPVILESPSTAWPKLSAQETPTLAREPTRPRDRCAARSGALRQRHKHQHTSHERASESQNGQGWKGPLWSRGPTPPPKQGHLQQAAQDLVQAT